MHAQFFQPTCPLKPLMVPSTSLNRVWLAVGFRTQVTLSLITRRVTYRHLRSDRPVQGETTSQLPTEYDAGSSTVPVPPKPCSFVLP